MNHERILYEDKDIIVCYKAAGIATQTARVGQADMVSEITNYLVSGGKAFGGHGSGDKGGEQRSSHTGYAPYVGVVHRLDQPVEGVLVFAKSRQAAAELGRQITENKMEKYYYAVICGQGYGQCGRLTDYLLKDGKTNTSRIVPKEVKGAKKAVLDYEIMAEGTLLGKKAEDEAMTDNSRLALARIRLHTGRHHQIRVQMSNAGMSLLGDYKYADKKTVGISRQMHVKEVALCAYQLIFFHPRTGKRMQFQALPEGKSFQAEEFLACYGAIQE